MEYSTREIKRKYELIDRLIMSLGRCFQDYKTIYFYSAQSGLLLGKVHPSTQIPS